MDDDIDNMNFPRYVFAVGGAGKELMYTVLSKEWILREILRPKFAATNIEITIVDTALDEENKDREKILRIERDIKRIEEEYMSNPSTDKSMGRITIQYMLLTKDMILQSPVDLVGIGENVKRATGAPIWWIKDSKLGDDWHKKVMSRENFRESNFSKGVYRKRAIGKAIYYKALSEGLFVPNILQNDQVDIIIGLGGGTGSGMALDLAKRLKSIQETADITLFGILSTLDESPDEKANNFAMLSELEFGILHKNSPFKDIVLVPMEMTKYPGKIKASDEHERLLREFDETFPSIFTSYHNNGPAQLLFANLQEYAPFIIASSQLVKYNVESIKSFKDRFIEALQDKEKSLADEDIIYNGINKFIKDFYGEDSNNIDNIHNTDHTHNTHNADKAEDGNSKLTDDDKLFIEERFSKLKAILEHEFFKELNYNSVIHILKAVNAGVSGSGSSDIIKQISSIRSEVDAIAIGDKSFRDDVDSILYKILRKDIETLYILKETLVMSNRVLEYNIKDALKAIIKVDEDSMGRKLNIIRDDIDTLNSKKRILEGNVRSLTESLKKFEIEMEEIISKSSQKWLKDENKNINLLKLLDESEDLLQKDAERLDKGIEEYANKIASLNSFKTIDSEPVGNIEDLIDNLNKDIGRIDIPEFRFEDKNLIMRNLTNLKELRKAQIEVKKGIPILDKAISIISKTGKVKKVEAAKKRLNIKTLEIQSEKVFDVKGNIFPVTYRYDTQKMVDSNKDILIGKVETDTREAFKNADEELILTLKTLLKTDKVGETNIEEIIKSHLGYSEEKSKRDNELGEKQLDLAQISRLYDMFKNIEHIIKNITPVLKDHSEKFDNYHKHITDIGKNIKAMYRTNKENIRYVMELQPLDIFRATAVGANINNILEDEREEGILKQNLQYGIVRTTDNKYNVILRRTIQTEDKRWDKTKVMNSLVTIANSVSPQFVDSRRTIMNSFALNRPNYSDWKCPWGDMWGVGIVLFISGVPLDNINNVIDSRDGYYRHYSEIEKKGLGGNFFHHSLLLEKGKMIKRRKIFNIESEEDKLLFLQDDKEIDNMLSENFEETDIKDILQ